MENNLYPLIYKPGIKRDGSLFQADYCTDGQWVRFQRGNIRKMGSMKGVTDPALIDKKYVTNITILPYNNSDMIIFTAASNTLINKSIITQQFEHVKTRSVGGLSTQEGATILKSEIIIQGNNKRIVFLYSFNASNVNNLSEAALFSVNVDSEDENLVKLPNPPKLAGLNGLLYASNYLFVYGANGLVQWSKLKEPTDFTNSDQRSINISNDAVIDAKSIRGGTNTPTILFWTLSSVIKCINTPDSGGNLQFQIDVISQSSSILSTRSVVEYDGLFFWPGTNRFFQYNGIVQELPNTMNLNYFFDNLDMDRRQQVFGIKNTKYGEIWWFYPERKGSPYRDPDLPDGVNSRAIIYNIRDNAWYDTSISRSAGCYSEAFGFMCTYGKNLTKGFGDKNTLFRHEFENLTRDPNKITETYLTHANGIRTVPITSIFTTPVFSWAAFNPMKQLTGNDKWMFLTTIEPDFILKYGDFDMNVTVNTKQYANSLNISSQPFRLPSPIDNQNDNLPKNAKIDISFQGRHMTLTFEALSTNFEMGCVMLALGIGDGK